MLLLAQGCKQPEARKPITIKTKSFIDTSVKRNIALNEAEYKIIETVIKADTTNVYQPTEYGFWYTYHNKAKNDSLTTPKFGDIVKYTYSVSKLDGTVIYTAKELGEKQYAMDQEELFSGLREGLKLLKAGEEATFLFPSQKAYGYYGDQKRITANTPLKLRVTILSITHTQH